ncbi:hypothetical protein C1645_812202 [Glomus cerebriforme]|uniref:DM13 domain-containing protein n=1 Tax=Glomus cerebriforme TaxID=658196 RepID=A0A397TKW6_9GLOM|nr:hypothetical protein C1645_812202 [Glomus cerebriforme]
MALTKMSKCLFMAIMTIFTFSTITVFASNSSSDPYVVFDSHGDIEKASGKISFIPDNNDIQVLGQFNTGLTINDKDAYDFLIFDDQEKLFGNETSNIVKRLIINPPGCAPFTYTTDSYEIDDLVGKYFVVKRSGDVIGKGEFLEA